MHPKARLPSVDDCCRWLRCSGWITGQGTGRYTFRLHFRTRTRLPERPQEARRSRLHFAHKPGRQPHQDLRPVESPELWQYLSHWMKFHATLVFAGFAAAGGFRRRTLLSSCLTYNGRQLIDKGFSHNAINKKCNLHTILHINSNGTIRKTTTRP